MGNWYQAGLGEPKNPTLAKQWWQQHQGQLTTESLNWFEQAAKRDHSNAQLILATHYAKGAHNNKAAITWLKKAASLSNRDAQYLLGERYEQGDGLIKDAAIAQRWYDKAAAHQQPDALLRLAKHTPPSHQVNAYQRAANAGSAKAEHWLGMAYLAGEQLPADPTLGHYWLELAASHGVHEAAYQLSLQQRVQRSRCIG